MAGPTRQDAMQIDEGPPRFAYPKVGRVVAVRQSSCSVDVVLLDGGYLRDVPVLQPWANTTSGMMHLTAPTMDEEVWARKTYPNAGPRHRQSPHNDGKKGRDIYVLLLQAEGSSHSRRGIYAVGFGVPQVSEMLFPNVAELQDLFLHRHPSDLVTSIDWTGKWSLQHPQGARVTIGPTINRVRLEGRDVDKHWHLRNNRQNQTQVYLYVPIGTSPTHSASGESGPVVDESADERARDHVAEQLRHDGSHVVYTNAPVGGSSNPAGSILRESTKGHIIDTAMLGQAETHALDRIERATVSIDEQAPTVMVRASQLFDAQGARVQVQAGTTASVKAGLAAGIQSSTVVLKGGATYVDGGIVYIAMGGVMPSTTAPVRRSPKGPTVLNGTFPA